MKWTHQPLHGGSGDPVTMGSLTRWTGFTRDAWCFQRSGWSLNRSLGKRSLTKVVGKHSKLVKLWAARLTRKLTGQSPFSSGEGEILKWPSREEVQKDSNPSQCGRRLKGGKAEFWLLYKSCFKVRIQVLQPKKNIYIYFQAAWCLQKHLMSASKTGLCQPASLAGGWRDKGKKGGGSGPSCRNRVEKENPSSICWCLPAEEASAGKQESRMIIRRGCCRRRSSAWPRFRKSIPIYFKKNI